LPLAHFPLVCVLTLYTAAPEPLLVCPVSPNYKLFGGVFLF